LTDGREISGYLVSETAQRVSLKSAGGVINNFESGDVEAKHELPYSIMPNDLQSQMSLDDFVDLIEYMVSLKE
jgi:putative heme-binding domain-containing protein